ncbi:hypothetical protein BDK51DRAFT_16156, partial [Blyttiomyces helicus]
CSNRKFGMTQTQKYRLRKRLQGVDNVVDTLVQSGVQFRALEWARRIPKEHELTPLQKYWIKSKRYRNGLKPVSWVPNWTKVRHPRTWEPTLKHEPRPRIVDPPPEDL